MLVPVFQVLIEFYYPAKILEVKIKKETFVNNETQSRTFTLCKRKNALEKEMEKSTIFRRKRFNLDGPDGFQYYFHDIRKETMSAIRRKMGGGSVMVWAGIGYFGKTSIKFINGRMNSV